MTIEQMLTHLHPTTLARMAAEMLTHHADMDETTIDFHTEAAKQTYDTICRAGARLTSDDTFNDLIDIALDELLR